jgi:hypothetical protein
MADDLILGMAAGYEARVLEPFVFSLRRSGFAGSCCLYVQRGDTDARAFLAASGIDVVTFDSVYERLWSIGGMLRLPRRLIRLVEFTCLRILEGLLGRHESLGGPPRRTPALPSRRPPLLHFAALPPLSRAPRERATRPVRPTPAH